MEDKGVMNAKHYHDFSIEEERALTKSYLRKVDVRFLPIFCLVYCTAIWDRNNVGNAKAAGMEKYVGLHGEQFSWIISSFFYTYIFCEVPSNMILKKVGARIWIPFITIAWSVLCACMAAGKSYGSLITIRVIMGMFEAGLVPGFIYFASFWYTKRQLIPRLSLFFSAGTFAGIWAGPLAAGLQNIKGGLKGYQYIFIVEAGITVGIAIVMAFLLQNYPETATFITEDERAVAMQKLDSEKALARKASYSPIQVFKALSDWTVWAYALIFWAAASGGATQAIFGPTLIKAMGYTSTRAQVLSSVPSACGFVSQLLSMVIPRFYPRFSHLIMAYSAAACAFYAVIASVHGIHVRFSFLCLANFALSPIMPWVSAWMSHNVLGVTKKGVAAACLPMLGGIAGLIGSHIYRNKDAPQYRFGHLFICACNAFIFVVALGLNINFRIQNRRRDSKSPADISTYTEDELEDLCDKRPDHRYTY
ncbi:hypothetical protein GGI12_004481 [Dipsacomyces acuminosporus]|nr:hypothetical protein GGI12_004481 [Dipsacomyces acuminosporus]